MKRVNVRLTSESNQQLRWLASKQWTVTDAVRQGLLLGTTVSPPELSTDPLIHSRTLWLSSTEVEALRATGLTQSEAIRQAIAVAFSFYQRVHSLKEVTA